MVSIAAGSGLPWRSPPAASRIWLIPFINPAHQLRIISS
ncbi:unnamed protein product [Musa acuminata subsp. malaccensis]|uniref:(wild Malaysian banana) hypothetical protein n=1 Tax=Musa acuminata subsp. malaccensis TaxID=214687 RepID=A0A804I356_MUSAM|nr:unnamed protein product [Musa acuminata subsp. malaccensis]